MPTASASNANSAPADDSLLSQLTAGVAVVDGASRFVYANPAFCTMFDASTLRLRGAPIEILGAGSTALTPLLERARASARAFTARAHPLPMRDSRSGQADVSLTPLVDESLLIEVHPLAPDHNASSPLSGSLRGLAHEVKNPLAGVRGAAQLIKRRVHEPELIRLADLVITEADRLAGLADRLLHAGGKPHLAVVNLHEVTERARELIAAEATAALRLERDYDPSLPSLRVDADRLLQVLLNLMRNAMQAGAKSIRVRTRAEHEAQIGEQPPQLAVRIDVDDDGSGVPPAIVENLFQPLVSGRAGGTGLGLALAREIVQEHGGTIIWRSSRGATVFSVLLPLGGAHD